MSLLLLINFFIVVVGGKLVAMGDVTGTVSLLELCESLAVPQVVIIIIVVIIVFIIIWAVVVIVNVILL